MGRDEQAALVEQKAKISTLSVIIRFHNFERLLFLEEAIFSLALQHWIDLEVIVVLQNPVAGLRDTISEVITQQPW